MARPSGEGASAVKGVTTLATTKSPPLRHQPRRETTGCVVSLKNESAAEYVSKYSFHRI